MFHKFRNDVTRVLLALVAMAVFGAMPAEAEAGSLVLREPAAAATGLPTGTASASPGETPVESSAQALRGLRPRQPAGPPSLYELPPDTPVDRIVVKFHEGTRVRLRGDKLVTLPQTERDRGEAAARGLDAARVAADIDAVEMLVASDSRVLGLSRLFKLAEKTLADQRATGEAASGEQLADLDLYYELLVPAGTTSADEKDVLAQLNALASIEIAHAAPIPEPAAVVSDAVTPSFQSQQGYLNPAPSGIDANYAWTKTGGSGYGVIVIDVEWAWRTTHEDLPAAYYTNGTQSANQGFRNHGTAVIGEIVGKNNGSGVTGIAYNARWGYASVNSQSAASAIANAAAAVISGNIILIEMHQLGPAQAGCACGSQCHYIAMEYWQENYDAIKAATTNGRIVVEAAGNGDADFNDPVYGKRFYRTFRDSGAIIVGARQSSNGFAMCFSNYGYRVDVNAWGENVVTTGYGNLYNGGTEDSWYTQNFSGTSSASPIVVGAAADLQGASFSNPPYITRTPAEMRLRLMSNGTWEWSNTKFIGPQPNLRGALDQMLNGNRLPTANTDVFTMPKNTRLSILFNTLLANDTDPDGDARSVFWYDFVTLNGGITDCCHAGGFIYTPPLNFTGTDYLNYRIQDARGLVAIGTVAVTVQ